LVQTSILRPAVFESAVPVNIKSTHDGVTEADGDSRKALLFAIIACRLESRRLHGNADPVTPLNPGMEYPIVWRTPAAADPAPQGHAPRATDAADVGDRNTRP